jgi:pyridoxal phosphate enzyme (YggS family)
MNIERNLRLVRERIDAACNRAGRDPTGVEIVAVTKTHPPEIVRAAAALGLKIFGESKVQEARAKIPEVGGNLRWDLIGHLQTNKAREAVRLFDLIHSVDSTRLAEALETEAAKAGKNQRILLEVNVSGENSKFGIAPDRLAETLAAVNAMQHLAVEGLMTMAPFSDNPEKSRPYFHELRRLRDSTRARLDIPLPLLSMGMTGDFEIAVEEGSTLLRIGTAIFGERQSIRTAAES